MEMRVDGNENGWRFLRWLCIDERKEGADSKVNVRRNERGAEEKRGRWVRERMRQGKRSWQEEE